MMRRLLFAALIATTTAAHGQSINYASPMSAMGIAGLGAANNLSDVASMSAARTNLGLGTMAVQNASGVAITGGSVSGTPIGSPTPAAAALTTLAHTGAEFDQTINVVAPATGASVTLTPGTTIINPAAALLALGIALPACAANVNGELVRLVATKAITAVTLSATSGTLVGSLTALLTGGAGAFICYGATATWFRLY